VAEIEKLCDEAHSRFHAGDVPGERAASDPATIESRKRAAELRALGVTESEWNSRARTDRKGTESGREESRVTIPSPGANAPTFFVQFLAPVFGAIFFGPVYV
jgi:hypothetical protein